VGGGFRVTTWRGRGSGREGGESCDASGRIGKEGKREGEIRVTTFISKKGKKRQKKKKVTAL